MDQSTPDLPEWRKQALARYAEKRKAATSARRWPCRQCGCPMGWPERKQDKRNFGRRPLVCAKCVPDLRFRMLVARYGVDKAMFEAMYFDQDGACAIASCDREAISVDHCHRTGRVRGLLCQGCNAAIGVLEAEGWLLGARDYLLGQHA